MFSYETNIRVRYAETDQMGYVYYGNYAAFYEVARTEMLRSLGMTYKSMEQDGVMMPVLEMRTKYFKPAKYDENVTVKVTIKEKPGIRIIFHYDMFNEKQEHLNTGETTLVFVDMKKNKPCHPPGNFMEKISVFFD
ncbi:acyl-CoA thioester hydrolase YbgC [Pedobacter glucosidilyticus]|uniref:Acyl-CoA thioesterase n=1 Tax=Pedobacter aquae TaxID=2605747 RepID=A0A5C0VGB6_9SPHI|nr:MULTISPECIES: thioesterase family protein [Pedobacter]KHJ36551.1 acyl-CoA thioester hydrolase YbgC [Pedobacter glucosidilyticus]QEK51077.1 acyl-CoA thioesterase [Pedobacter aquae]